MNRATNHDVSLDLSFSTYLHMIFLSDQSRLFEFHIRNHSFFHASNRDGYVFLLGFRTDLCPRSDFAAVLLFLAFFTHYFLYLRTLMCAYLLYCVIEFYLSCTNHVDPCMHQVVSVKASCDDASTRDDVSKSKRE